MNIAVAQRNEASLHTDSLVSFALILRRRGTPVTLKGARTATDCEQHEDRQERYTPISHLCHRRSSQVSFVILSNQERIL